MLNPISHATTRTAADHYKVEPYVVAADVYAAPGHVGRGGWTWYTGSAGWLYRCGIEALRGLRKIGDVLEIDPAIATWPGFRVRFAFGAATYLIAVSNPARATRGVRKLVVDGRELGVDPAQLALTDDSREHCVEVM